MKDILHKYGWIVLSRNKHRQIDEVVYHTYYGFHLEPPYICPLTAEFRVVGATKVRKLVARLKEYAAAPWYKKLWWALTDKKFCINSGKNAKS